MAQVLAALTPYGNSYGSGGAPLRAKAAKNGRGPGEASTGRAGKDGGERAAPLPATGIALPLQSPFHCYLKKRAPIAEENFTLTTFYISWKQYQDRIKAALAALEASQLELRAAPHLRSLGELSLTLVIHGLKSDFPG